MKKPCGISNNGLVFSAKHRWRCWSGVNVAMSCNGIQLTMLVASTRSLRLLETLWDDLAQSRASMQLVMENRRKDATLRLCEWFSTPLIDSNGGVIGVI